MWESVVISKIRLIESSNFKYSLLNCVYTMLQFKEGSAACAVWGAQGSPLLPASAGLLNMCVWCLESLTLQCVGALSWRPALLAPAPGISRGESAAEEMVPCIYRISHSLGADMEPGCIWEMMYNRLRGIYCHAGLQSEALLLLISRWL